jgi:hypothetical protein
VRPPNLITNVATTAATVPDVKMTTPIHHDLNQRGLLPCEHYLDAGYPSAETITTASHEVGSVTNPDKLAFFAKRIMRSSCGGLSRIAFVAGSTC